jgi:hypothetical protein
MRYGRLPFGIVDAYRGDLAETRPLEIECTDQLFHSIGSRSTRIGLAR